MAQSQTHQNLYKILDAINRLSGYSAGRYIASIEIAQELNLDHQDVLDYLDILKAEEKVYITKTPQGGIAALTSIGRLSLKDPEYISTNIGSNKISAEIGESPSNVIVGQDMTQHVTNNYMNQSYHGFQIEGEREYPTMGDYDRCVFRVTLNNKLVFRHSVRISRSYLRVINSPEGRVDVTQLLLSRGFNRICGKIDLNAYEDGEDTEYSIVEDESQTRNTFTDKEIRLRILNMLYRVKRMRLERAKIEPFNVEGFCEILGIEQSDYLMNADYLLDKKYIADFRVQQHTVANGGIYITSDGIDYLEESKTYISSNANTEIGDGVSVDHISASIGNNPTNVIVGKNITHTTNIFQSETEFSPTPKLSLRLIKAIEGEKPNQLALCRQFMDWLIAEIDKLNPDFNEPNEKEHDDLLVEAINQSTELVVEFFRVAEAIATMKATECALSVYKSFGKLLARYERSNLLRPYRPTDFDLYKFLGHELFVVLFSCLIKENQWELIAKLLDEKIYIEQTPISTQKNVVSFVYISRDVELLEHRNQRLEIKKVSLHAYLLHERYRQGDLSIYVPARQFMEADYFLFLRSVLQQSRAYEGYWLAWSTLYMNNEPSMNSNAPGYLKEAIESRYAARLLKPLGLRDITEFRNGLANHAPKISRLFNSGRRFDPLVGFNVQQIGTE